MLYDCPECGEAYSADAGTVTICPKCDAENVASFEKPLGTPKSRRRGAWAAGFAAAFLILGMAAVSWASLDIDGDGVSTYREAQEGSNPFREDTDGDGLSDGWELDHGLDLLSRDSDGDGLDDRRELEQAIDAGGTVCSVLELLSGCSDPSGEPAPTEMPPEASSDSKGNGSTILFGGVSTVAAGVAARLVSAAILKK